MAIIKVHWDNNRDILDNYIPLLSYALSECNSDIVATEEIEPILKKSAGFDIPQAVLISLLKRASKQKHNLIEKQGDGTGTYKINRGKINNAPNYLDEKEAAEKQYKKLQETFEDYLRKLNIKIKAPPESYFFSAAILTL